MADEQEHTGGMIALVPADPGSLAVDGGDPTDQLHLTLAFLGNDVSTFSDATREALIKRVGEMSRDLPPVEARIMGHALWNPDGGPDGDMDACAVYQVQPHPDIDRARQYSWDMASATLGADWPEQFHGFLPHVTAGYGLEPSVLKYTGPVMFDKIRLALGGEVQDFPLGGYAGGPERAFSDKENVVEMAAKTIEEAPPEADAEPPKLDENSGIPVTFPVIIVEGMETSDGRFIEPGALGHRALPLPILAQTRNPEGGDGHAGADVIGRLDTLERVAGSEITDKETGKPFPEGVFVWRGTGFIDPEAAGTKLAQKGYLTGNSADLSDVEAEFVWGEAEGDDGTKGPQQIRMTAGKIAATTLVPIPAFAQAYVQIDGETVTPAAETLTAAASPAWVAAEVGDDCFLCAAGIPEGFAAKQVTEIVAGAAPEIMLPSVEMFTKPNLTGPTPLTLLDAEADFGFIEVVGHLATWGTCHTGFAGQCVTPPRSRQDYGYFNVGAVRALGEDGEKITVAAGHITMGEGGHAGIKMSAADAAAFYDNVNTVVADVTAGEDEYGIWVHGVVRRSATPEQVEALRAAPLSGDWRTIDGSLELVAALAVNSGGFPIPRARVASGVPMALVAAGAVPQPEANAEFETREPVATGAVVLDYDVLADAIAKRLNGEITLRVNEETQQRGDALREEIFAARGQQLRDAFFGDKRETLAWELEFAPTPEQIEFARKNWVEKAGGLPPYIKRIAKHLQKKGMEEGQAIATAKNAADKMCKTGDVNFPGKQDVNAGSRAEACAAIKDWDRKRKAS